MFEHIEQYGGTGEPATVVTNETKEGNKGTQEKTKMWKCDPEINTHFDK